jgi:ATP-dependent RNA helicase SUPV3L1/SUV3
VEAGAPASTEAAPARDPGKGRPPRERFQGKGRDKDKFQGTKGGREGRPDAGDHNSHRQVHSSAPPRERDRPIDPNSPFAKLAALKEQLTANRKDQR